MFSTLPDFTPRDSHSLWYTSTRNPLASERPIDALPTDPAAGNSTNAPRQRPGQVLERTALARLAAEESYMQRRRLNIQNFGSGWLRPPGITKTLHQLREEKREQEEHQEAMRREQLAQELAEAEAGNMEEEGGMDDVQLDGAQDLDEEIPDADADADFALGGSDTEEEEEDDDLDEDEERSEDSDSDGRREERQNDLMAARMRMTDDAYRQALARGDPDGDDLYGGAEELAEEDNGHILDEEDFAGEGSGYLLDDGEGYEDLGMDADLDDDAPEAESGMYEHTDSEAELESSRVLSSDDEDRDVDQEEEVEEEEDQGNDIGFAPRAAPLGPPQSPTLMSRNRRITNISTGRPSLDINTLLSQDESSFMDSSPIQNRRARQG
ncbi:hypothetical protein VHEMI03799 [[Torrubiella] hemipterigena]|uniref:Anaphase-promoting complex, subunit 15/MND2 n=1 Tax=[Torrubiella] hemipterigena TaxID=1531966 RepID=A0A0A1TCB4_9HYPO|nr:hypothetical protein VHEMI03799 [[Torrubiella] hemipterigena]